MVAKRGRRIPAIRVTRTLTAAGRTGALAALTFAVFVSLWVSLSAGCSAGQAPTATGVADWLEPAVVVKHVDGDTIRVVVDGVEEPIRLIGIDTPESTNKKEPWGREASDFTKSLAPIGTTVYLEFDAEARDRYDRLLAYVWLEPTETDAEAAVRTKMLNARIALAGLASPLTIQPNSKYAHLFAAYVIEARLAEEGMWNPAAVPLPVR